jgi:hypothetical protein
VLCINCKSASSLLRERGIADQLAVLLQASAGPVCGAAGRDRRAGAAAAAARPGQGGGRRCGAGGRAGAQRQPGARKHPPGLSRLAEVISVLAVSLVAHWRHLTGVRCLMHCWRRRWPRTCWGRWWLAACRPARRCDTPMLWHAFSRYSLKTEWLALFRAKKPPGVVLNPVCLVVKVQLLHPRQTGNVLLSALARIASTAAAAPPAR